MEVANPGQSMPISMLYGMNPSARRVGTSGWATFGELSVVASASPENCQVTPAELIPRHVSLVIISTRAKRRMSFGLPWSVMMIVGSMKRFVTPRSTAEGVGHFCQPLYVSIEARLYLYLTEHPAPTADQIRQAPQDLGVFVHQPECRVAPRAE